MGINEDPFWDGLGVAIDNEAEAAAYVEAVQAIDDWCDVWLAELNRLRAENASPSEARLEEMAAECVKAQFNLLSFTAADAKRFLTPSKPPAVILPVLVDYPY